MSPSVLAGLRQTDGTRNTRLFLHATIACRFQLGVLSSFAEQPMPKRASTSADRAVTSWPNGPIRRAPSVPAAWRRSTAPTMPNTEGFPSRTSPWPRPGVADANANQSTEDQQEDN